MSFNNEDLKVIELNVGGENFATSKETLTWIPHSFFCSMLSGRIKSTKDKHGAYFIDRDPSLFRVILNYLRTKRLHVENVNLKALKHEAEYFCLQPLINQLNFCEDIKNSSCSNLLFHGMLQSPCLPESSEVVDKTVRIITGHNSWIAVAYTNHILCYKVKESSHWQQVFTSPYLKEDIKRLSINTKVQGMAPESKTKMIAVAFKSKIKLWSFADDNNFTEIGVFHMSAKISNMLFIGSQLVAYGAGENNLGKVGVWNAVSQHWQKQDIVEITSHDTAASYLLLGGSNGAIYYIDMQKFPLRLKDNDLLITELYRDRSCSPITALSVYLTPKNSVTSNNWIEVAYGTANGTVCVVVQHPELVGQGFQLFQTFTVHRSPVVRVMLSEKFLVSVCSDNNHVRTWSVTRFRGMISTQPGSKPYASFKVSSIDPYTMTQSYKVGNDIGPHGEREDDQIFIQKFLPNSSTLFVRTSSSGKRLAEIKSVEGVAISCFCLHTCSTESPSRVGSRSLSYLFTGHVDGTIQIWDLSSFMESTKKDKNKVAAEELPMLLEDNEGGLTQEELFEFFSQSNITLGNDCFNSSDKVQSRCYDDLKDKHCQNKQNATQKTKQKHQRSASASVPFMPKQTQRNIFSPPPKLSDTRNLYKSVENAAGTSTSAFQSLSLDAEATSTKKVVSKGYRGLKGSKND